MAGIPATLNDLREYLPAVIEAVYNELHQPHNDDLRLAFAAIEGDMANLEADYWMRLGEIVATHDVRDTKVTRWETVWGVYRRLQPATEQPPC